MSINQLPGKDQWCSFCAWAHLRFHGAKEPHRGRTSKLAQSFINARVAILPLPVPHTEPQLNSSPSHSSSLFLSLEKTPHLRNHWGCFLKVPVWQGDRGHHSLPFLLFGKTGWNWKGGPQLPPRRPSLPLIKPPTVPIITTTTTTTTTAQHRPPPRPGWTPLVGSQTSPVCVIPAVLWEADKEQEARGSTGQAWRSAQSVSVWWMQRGGRVTWKCTKQAWLMHAPLPCPSLYLPLVHIQIHICTVTLLVLKENCLNSFPDAGARKQPEHFSEEKYWDDDNELDFRDKYLIALGRKPLFRVRS